jgi:hypothetical protein
MKKSLYLVELFADIDRGTVEPLTSVKNIEATVTEFADDYEDYEAMIRDLEEWNYIKLC